MSRGGGCWHLWSDAVVEREKSFLFDTAMDPQRAEEHDHEENRQDQADENGDSEDFHVAWSCVV